MFGDPEIAEAAMQGTNAQDVCDRLLQLTLERGATDNVSIIVVRFRQDESSNETTQAVWGKMK